MTRRKVSPLFSLGLLMLSCGLGLRLWTHGNYSDFASGFLTGMSIVLLIGGLMKQKSGTE